MAQRKPWLSFAVFIFVNWCAVECGVFPKANYTQSGGDFPQAHTPGLNFLTGPYFGKYKNEPRKYLPTGTKLDLPEGHYNDPPLNYTAEYAEWLGAKRNGRLAVGASVFEPFGSCRRV